MIIVSFQTHYSQGHFYAASEFVQLIVSELLGSRFFAERANGKTFDL